MTIESGHTEPHQPGGVDALVRVPQRSMLADEVYQILKESLLSHRIAPGARLNLDQLARELHVSNTPVRQALARLESDGLVSKEPYRGFTASPILDSRAIAELYDYRLLIEPPTAARAARRRREDGLARLVTLCDRDEVGRLIDDPSAQELIGTRDIEFHTTIAREAGNGVVVDNLVVALSRMRLYTIYHRTGVGQHAWEEHRAIVAAIEAADPEAAAAEMRTHLSNGLERLREAIA